MTALLSIKTLEPSLSEPGYWTQQRLLVLKSIKDAIGDDQRIRVKDHPSISRAFGRNIKMRFGRENGTLTKADKLAINEVISKLQDNGWNCRFLSIPQKRIRASVLPSTAEELASQHHFEQIRGHFWGEQVEQLNSITPENADKTAGPLITAIILETAAGLGLKIPHLCYVLEQLNNAAPPLSSMAVKVHPDAEEHQCLWLPLSARMALLISTLYRIRKQVNNIKARRGTPLAIPTTPREIRYRINSAFDRSLLKPQMVGDIVLIDRKSRSNQLIAAARTSPLYQGMEPVIFTQLQAPILPLSPPKETGTFCFTRQNGGLAWPRIIHRPRLDKEPVPAGIQPHLLSTFEDDCPDAIVVEKLGWFEECRIGMRRAIHQFRRHLTDETGDYQNTTVPAELCEEVFAGIKAECIERVRQRIEEEGKDKAEKQQSHEVMDRIENTISNLDLAIAWGRYRLIDEQLRLKTFAQDLSSIFNQGFFNYTSSFDLTNWDEEDAEILVADYLLNRPLEAGTIKRISSLLRRIVEFAREGLSVFQTIEFPLIHSGGMALTRRNHVLGLQELDLITDQINQNDEENGEKLAAVLDLAFYGGLRAGEIANLTLNSIVTSKQEMVLYLPAFKTPSAKRSVPLHLIAPPKVQQRIQSVIDLRNIDYRRYHNKKGTKESCLPRNKVKLFSLDSQIESSSSRQLVSLARQVLQQIAGDGTDLHLLRHCFATHIFLRWYCCRHEDLIVQLLEREHWVYSQQGIGRLRTFLGEKPETPLPATHVTGMVNLIKLMGHKTIQTFFQVYVHSFETVACHALNKADARNGTQVLTGKAIANLLPNMRSRTSQLKLIDRSINGLAQHLKRDVLVT